MEYAKAIVEKQQQSPNVNAVLDETDFPNITTHAYNEKLGEWTIANNYERDIDIYLYINIHSNAARIRVIPIE